MTGTRRIAPPGSELDSRINSSKTFCGGRSKEFNSVPGFFSTANYANWQVILAFIRGSKTPYFNFSFSIGHIGRIRPIGHANGRQTFNLPICPIEKHFSALSTQIKSNSHPPNSSKIQRHVDSRILPFRLLLPRHQVAWDEFPRG